MASTLYHKPGYTTADFFQPEKGVYFRRLGHPELMLKAIQSKPASNDKPYTAIVYGELFNAQEVKWPLRAKDLKTLSGFYCLACSDDAGCMVAVDRRASEPIYYMQVEDCLYFAPEVKALVAGCGRKVRPNEGAIAIFLSAGHLLAHQTLVDGIRKLQGGHVLIIRSERISLKEYWRYEVGARAESPTPSMLVDNLGEMLTRAVARSLGNPETAAIFLSGGTDSRGILGGALETVQQQGRLLHTVNWGTNPDEANSDPQVAGLITSNHNLNHQFYPRLTHNYGEWFEEVNYIIDGMCDVSAVHPYEFQIMKQLHAAGYRRVLRGDTLHRPGQEYDALGALSHAGIRRLRWIKGLDQVMQKDAYARCAEAGDAEFQALFESCRGMAPDDIKDYLHFYQRLQTYFGSAAYYKRVLFIHRTPLLDDEILDFFSLLSIEQRLNKALYMQAIQRRYPELYKYPFSHGKLENWDLEIRNDTSIRRYIESHVADHKSGIWKYFNRIEIEKILKSMNPKSTAAPGLGFKRSLRRLLLDPNPRIGGWIMSRRGRQLPLSKHDLLMRLIVLKHWHDQFVDGI
jgi:asparagine synthetase B (glutamine-hydrolysing)